MTALPKPEQDVVEFGGSLHEWRLKFTEISEHQDSLVSILARVETNVSIAKIEFQEQLRNIFTTLSQLNRESNEIKQLHQEVSMKREEHAEIKRNELRLTESIENLERKIINLEMIIRNLWHERILFGINVVALIILSTIVLYHIFIY